MVRLKVCCAMHRQCPKAHFNSTMVRLKDWSSVINLEYFFNFNSTMVRLKAFQVWWGILATAPFQFHYGTIKRQWLSSNTFSVSLFQFHYGTIKSAILNKRILKLEKFQFHYGTIKSLLPAMEQTGIKVFQFHYGTIKRKWYWYDFWTRFKISIPLWYD